LPSKVASEGVESPVKNQLARLRKLTLRALWAESPEYRTRRRCRTVIATPFAALAGVAWGVLSTDAIGAGSRLLWGSLGGASFALLIYFELLLLPRMASLANRVLEGSGVAAAVVWELAIVGGLAFLVTTVLGTPVVPAIGTAVGIGAMYTLVMEYVLCGSAASDLVSITQGTISRGTGAERYSHAETLIQQGRFEEAIAIYRAAIDVGAGTLATFTGLARALVGRGDPEAAADELRKAATTGDLPYAQKAFVVRQIHELCSSKLGNPAAAADDLRTFLSLRADGPHAEWAARELDYIDGNLIDDVERRDRDPTEPFSDEPIEVDAESGLAGTAEASEQAFPLEVEGPHRLTVDDDFRIGTEYDLGADLVLEDDLAPSERYSVAWDTEIGPEGIRTSESEDAGVPTGPPNEDSDSGDQHRAGT
jgi:hypothetical protein